MKKVPVISAMVILFLAGAGCGTVMPEANVNLPETNAAADTSPVEGKIPFGDIGYQPVAASAEVKMENFSFYPPEVTIKKGGKVTWTNRDPVRHSVTGDGWQSELLDKSQSFSQTFDKAGIYQYHCTPHPGMTGKITVVE